MRLSFARLRRERKRPPKGYAGSPVAVLKECCAISSRSAISARVPMTLKAEGLIYWGPLHAC
jgi:hypothetical protein